MNEFAGNRPEFHIAEEDRIWVEENFDWLMKVFGYPNAAFPQTLFNAKHFPTTFGSGAVNEKALIADLCAITAVEPTEVELVPMPDFMQEPFFVPQVGVTETGYRIMLSRHTRRSDRSLAHGLIHAFVRVKLIEGQLEFDTPGDDNQLFVYLAGVYNGMGIALAETLLATANHSPSPINWGGTEYLPVSVLVFAIALYMVITGETNPEWKKELSPELNRLLNDALDYLAHDPSDLSDDGEIRSNQLFNLADEQFENDQLDEAISTLQKILFVTSDEHMKADVFNNMGYYHLKKGLVTKGISDFRKALSFGDQYGFANDNLGYALIRNGELEEGKLFLDRALDTGNNDPYYSYRNQGLYYHRIGDYKNATHCFEKASEGGLTVDLLEFHYAELLLDMGKTAHAVELLKKASIRKEPEVLQLLASLAAIDEGGR